MHSSDSPFLVAAAQVAPVFLDKRATTRKAAALIREAGTRGARLVVFPEAFIPGYPFWVWKLPPEDSRTLRALYAELLDQAVRVPDDATEELAVAAGEAGVAVVVGINEVVSGKSGTLYNSVLTIGPDGRIAGVHRKLVPTTAERLVHGQGDGSTLDAHEMPFGTVGGLICWENYMPLARYALYAAGVEIWTAPTWDRGEPWISTLRHIAKEGRVYVIGCGSAVRAADVPERVRAVLPPADGWLNPGGSAIVDPDGKLVVEPVLERQELIFGEVVPARIRGPRFQLDVTGHYARPDVFRLTVDRAPRPAVHGA